MMHTPRHFFNRTIVIFLFVLVSILCAWLLFLYTPIIEDEKGIKFTIREGSSIRTVVDELQNKQILKHPILFNLYVRLKGVSKDLKAGEYLFPKNSTPASILKQITTGNGLVYHAFTIVPGWNFKELRHALLRDPSLKHTLQDLNNAAVMAKLGHPQLNPEGQFFPDTYYFAQGSEDLIILRRSFKEMQDKLNAAWAAREAGLPFKTSYEALIGASIIEKEAFFEEELPKIAGVMINRLRKDMLLQFDPTIIYGRGDQYEGKIRKADLLAKNPYNTYLNKGLTPTPICMPSLAAIDAILHPAQHDYYYFVAQSDGSSTFSKYLSEHQKAVVEARKITYFFNTALSRYYLLKRFSLTHYNAEH